MRRILIANRADAALRVARAAADRGLDFVLVHAPGHRGAWTRTGPARTLDGDGLAAREALYRRLLTGQYERGGAINMAASLEIDAVIDPAEARRWVMRGVG